jgi:monothiol glutaredoxin
MSDVNTLQKEYEQLIKDNKVLIFMKGNPAMPMCGFSAFACETLKQHGVQNFAHVDILPDPNIRPAIKNITQWPTFPQIFINHEFVGGSDILGQMAQAGDLEKMLKV